MHPIGYEDWWIVDLDMVECPGMPITLWPLQSDECFVLGSPAAGFVPAPRLCRLSDRDLALDGSFRVGVWTSFEADWSGFSGPGVGCYDADAFTAQTPPRCELALG